MFAPPPHYSARQLAVYAAVSAALVVGMSPMAFDNEAGVLQRSQLASASGKVTSVSKHRYGVKFTLVGRPETFDYPSKAAGVNSVLSVLSNPNSSEISILFDPEPRRPWFSGDEYHDVWEVALPNRRVRALSESQAAWRSDNSVSLWLFCIFSAIAAYFTYFAWRRHTNATFR